MRGRNSCRGCSRRGRTPVGFCGKCHAAFCDRHGSWAEDQWLCSKCKRGKT